VNTSIKVFVFGSYDFFPLFWQKLNSTTKERSVFWANSFSNSIFDFSVIMEMCIFQSMLHRTEQMIIAWRQVRRIRWVRENLPFELHQCLFHGYNNMEPNVVMEKNHFSAIWWGILSYLSQIIRTQFIHEINLLIFYYILLLKVIFLLHSLKSYEGLDRMRLYHAIAKNDIYKSKQKINNTKIICYFFVALYFHEYFFVPVLKKIPRTKCGALE